jgi:hypothetical protein
MQSSLWRQMTPVNVSMSRTVLLNVPLFNICYHGRAACHSFMDEDFGSITCWVGSRLDTIYFKGRAGLGVIEIKVFVIGLLQLRKGIEGKKDR